MDDLDQLARWPTIGARHSEETFELATRVLSKRNLGDQEWSIREQLAIAALDLGRIQAGKDQIDVLYRKFSKSPRLAILAGLHLEAQGNTEGAKAAYKLLLEQDETNVSAHQRLIALTPSPQTIPVLLKYLDVFYTDPAGWSFLAELYADQGLYPQSMTALGHVMLINTWDSGVVCRAAETAYTMGDNDIALKYFLRAVEMEGEGKARSWWGVKMTTRRMDPTEKIKALEQLATERILASSGSNLDITRKVLGEGITTR